MSTSQPITVPVADPHDALRFIYQVGTSLKAAELSHNLLTPPAYTEFPAIDFEGSGSSGEESPSRGGKGNGESPTGTGSGALAPLSALSKLIESGTEQRVSENSMCGSSLLAATLPTTIDSVAQNAATNSVEGKTALSHVVHALVGDVIQRALAKRSTPLQRYESLLLRFIASSSLALRMDTMNHSDVHDRNTEEDGSDVSQLARSLAVNFDETLPERADVPSDPRLECRVLMQLYDTCCEVFGTVPLSSVLDRLSSQEGMEAASSIISTPSLDAKAFSGTRRHYETGTGGSSITNIYFGTGALERSESQDGGGSSMISHASRTTAEGIRDGEHGASSLSHFELSHPTVAFGEKVEMHPLKDISDDLLSCGSHQSRTDMKPSSITCPLRTPLLVRRETLPVNLTDCHFPPTTSDTHFPNGLRTCNHSGTCTPVPDLAFLPPHLRPPAPTIDQYTFNFAFCEGLGRPECLIPFLSLLEGFPQVTFLSLAGVGLDDASVHVLALLCEAHLPALRHLDLSHNRDITNESMKPLRHLVEERTNIHQVSLKGISMVPMYVKSIEVLAQRNAEKHFASFS